MSSRERDVSVFQSLFWPLEKEKIFGASNVTLIMTLPPPPPPRMDWFVFKKLDGGPLFVFVICPDTRNEREQFVITRYVSRGSWNFPPNSNWTGSVRLMASSSSPPSFSSSCSQIVDCRCDGVIKRPRKRTTNDGRRVSIKVHRAERTTLCCEFISSFKERKKLGPVE